MRDQWSMSNSLKVSLQTTIYSLHERGWSRRRIARELGIDRETVGRYLRLAKPAISTAGLEEAGSKTSISTAGNGVGRKSQCEPPARSDHGQGGGRAQRATYLPGFGGGKRLHRFLPIGKALCAQAASGLARADLGAAGINLGTQLSR
jgi:hypothetical protein